MFPRLFISVFLLVLVHSNLAAKWHDCGSKTSKLVDIQIPGCETLDRCALKHGTNQTVTIIFTPSIQITDLKAKVYGQLGPVSVPFPLPNPDGCTNSNLTCPLSAGQQYAYSSAIYVDPSYPSIQVVVKWELIDQTGAQTVCFQVPVQVVNAKAGHYRRHKILLFGNHAYFKPSEQNVIEVRDINA